MSHVPKLLADERQRQADTKVVYIVARSCVASERTSERIHLQCRRRQDRMTPDSAGLARQPCVQCLLHAILAANTALLRRRRRRRWERTTFRRDERRADTMLNTN